MPPSGSTARTQEASGARSTPRPASWPAISARSPISWTAWRSPPRLESRGERPDSSCSWLKRSRPPASSPRRRARSQPHSPSPHRTGQPSWDADLHRLDGDLLLATGGPADEAAARYHRALAIAREQGARSFELRAATSLARLWRDQGKRAEARDLLAPIYGWFSEGFDTRDLLDAKALLEELR